MRVSLIMGGHSRGRLGLKTHPPSIPEGWGETHRRDLGVSTPKPRREKFSTPGGGVWGYEKHQLMGYVSSREPGHR